jgi:uncharacterized phage infection (PIP) family protein YhgE
MLTNRKHFNVVSYYWLCDDCSTKRYIDVNNDEVRISDGSYNVGARLAKERYERKEKDIVEGYDKSVNRDKKLFEDAKSRVNKSNSIGDKNGDDDRNELFGKLIDGVKDMFNNTDDATTTTKTAQLDKQNSDVNNVKNNMAEARNRLNERGEKLNDLAEKSERLNNQSKQFADIAKQLNQKNSGISGWFN